MILALETTGTLGHFAFSAAPQALGTVGPQGLVEKLFPALKEELARLGKKPSDLTAISVALGPGSFTGLRVGLSTAKSLAWALAIPLYGYTLPDLCAEILNRREGPGPTRILLDARRQGVYTAFYNSAPLHGRPVPVGSVADVSLEHWPELFETKSEAIMGDGGAPIRQGGILPPNLVSQIPAPNSFYPVSPLELTTTLLTWAREDLLNAAPGMKPFAAEPLYVREGVATLPILNEGPIQN